MITLANYLIMDRLASLLVDPFSITPGGPGRDIQMHYVQKIKAYSTHTHDQKHLTAFDIG